MNTLHNDELEKLWDIYSKKFGNDEYFAPILNRGYMYSDVKACDILVIGINPSCRKGDGKLSYNSFLFSKARDSYFNKFHNILTTVDPLGKFSVDYIDLLNIRITEQKQLSNFFKSQYGMEFVCEQLSISQKIIESLKPKLILVFNGLASNMFGVNAKPIGDEFNNVWLGYDFYEPEKYKCKIISGLKGSKERINKDSVKETNLIGVPVYFSKYLGRAKKSDITQIKEDIKEIIDNHIFFENNEVREPFINSVNKLNDITTRKMKAIKNQLYEDSARLRDVEKQLLLDINKHLSNK